MYVGTRIRSRAEKLSKYGEVRDWTLDCRLAQLRVELGEVCARKEVVTEKEAYI